MPGRGDGPPSLVRVATFSRARVGRALNAAPNNNWSWYQGTDTMGWCTEKTAMDPSQETRFIDDVVAAAYRLQEDDMLGESFGALPSGAPGPSPAEVAAAKQQAEALVQNHSF